MESASTIESENKNHESSISSSQNFSFPDIKEEAISYQIDEEKFAGFVSYKKDQQGKRPAILVVPEWWGLNDYTRRRAKQLADLGYIAMAVDMYGNGTTAEDPATAQKLVSPFYNDPSLAKKRIDAAIDFLKTYPQTDPSQMAAIGYCFGGFVVLSAATSGAELKGVVSFHGSLSGVKPLKNINAKFLVCHGGADQFENSHVDTFKKEMDAAGVDYIFNVYPNASHAYSNPNATAKGEKYNMPIKYNAEADSASWSDMKKFLKELFH